MRATHPTACRACVAWERGALLATLLLLASTGTSVAGFVGPVPAFSHAGITYNVDVVSGPSGGPAYGPNNDLQNINALLPGLGYGSIALGSNVSNFGNGFAVPTAALGSLSAGQAATGTATGVFGGGSASLFAATTKAGAGAGVFWTTPTFLIDSPTPGKASVALSRGDARFTDPTGDLIPPGKTAGIALAISGTLGGSAGAFIAATLAGTFTVRNAADIVQSTLTASVVIVTDGNGVKPDVITSTGGGLLTSGSIGFGTNNFYAFGNLLLPAFSIPAGGSVELDGTLSFVADPDSSMILDILPNTFQPFDLSITAVLDATPEPASLLMTGMGMLATLGAYWRSRRTGHARPGE